MDTSLAFAEVLKTWLNEQTWPQAMVAEVPPDLQPPADPAYYNDALRCIVLPREDEYLRLDRDVTIAADYQIDSFIACHIDFMAASVAYSHVHAIVKKLMKEPLALQNAFVTGVRRTLWLPNHLQDKKIFGTVITVDVRTIDDED